MVMGILKTKKKQNYYFAKAFLQSMQQLKTLISACGLSSKIKKTGFTELLWCKDTI